MIGATLARLRTALVGTLRRRLILGVALVHAVLMAGFVWDLTLRQQDMLLEHQHEQAEALSTSLAATASNGLVARDLAGLRELVAAQVAYPELAFAMILDRQGQVLAHSDIARHGQYVQELPARVQWTLRTDTTGLADAFAPVRLSGQHVGWVRVGLTQRSTQAKLGAITRNGVLYGLLAIVVGSLLAAGMGRWLTRRLDIIQDASAAVESGDFTRRAELSGSDEAATLAHAFNRMLDAQAAAGAELAASAQVLRIALDAASMGAWRWDLGADRKVWGDEPQRLLGPRPAEGYPDMRDMVLPQDRERYLHASLAAIAAGTDYNVEFRIRRTDGQIRWLHSIGRVTRDLLGRPLAMLGVTQDISARKLVEQMLQESEARANLIIDCSPDAMLIVDAKGCILRANSRVEALLGYSGAELVGQSIELLLPDGLREAHVQLRTSYAQAPTPRRMGRLANIVARCKDGRVQAIDVSLAPMQLGAQTQIIATVRDMTQSRALEAELTQHRNHLEDLVAARTAELTAARNEAERLARVKGEFLANMSHEIRTPLNAVLGLARLGLRGGADFDPQEAFGRINVAGSHLLDVINDILDFSRLEAGRLDIERSPFDFSAMLATTRSLVADDAQAKGLRMEFTVAPELQQRVVGDARRIQQILVNLLANAVKFSEHGEVRLRVAREGDEVWFMVTDTGIGMSAEQVARLFQPFEQADSSTTRRFGGSGLGLAISSALARRMGGEILVDSALGKGSSVTLRVTLPPVDAAPAQRPVAATTAASRLAGLRLLAAEDLDVNRMILEAMLVHEGAQVVFAENGQQAIDRLNEHGIDAFDAVLMDVQMPVMDGLEATRYIRQLAPALPVIGLTAHALADERDKCLAAGMVQHVTKPIDIDTLVAAIRRHVAEAPGVTSL